MLIFYKNRPNVSRFETEDKKEAAAVKKILDENHIYYATCITSTQHPLATRVNEWKVVFNIYSRRANADLLKLMFEMGES